MTLSRAEKLDKIFGTPLFAVLLAIFCNVLWGCAFPFIKMGYRLFEIDPSNTASIFCFAGIRFMLGSLLVLLGSTLLQSRMPTFPKGKVFAECCVLGLWQTTTQYAFYYIAVAMLTGAFGGGGSLGDFHRVELETRGAVEYPRHARRRGKTSPRVCECCIRCHRLRPPLQ